MSRARYTAQAVHFEASRLLANASVHVERIAIAGSLRRLLDDPDPPDWREVRLGDLEIVAIPRVSVPVDLFGDPIPAAEVNETLAWLDRVAPLPDSLVRAFLRDDGKRQAWGERYRKLALGDDGLACDLFLARPDNWGLILALRTGPRAFSKRIATRRALGGLLPDDMRVWEGSLWQRVPGGTGRVIPTPSEEAFSAATGIDLPRPHLRGRS